MEATSLNIYGFITKMNWFSLLSALKSLRCVCGRVSYSEICFCTPLLQLVAISQEHAVAAVRTALQGQLDDLNSIFDSQVGEFKIHAVHIVVRPFNSIHLQLSEAIAQARIDARDEARVNVEKRISAAVAEAVAAAQRDADRLRVEAVRTALATAAG